MITFLLYIYISSSFFIYLFLLIPSPTGPTGVADKFLNITIMIFD